jgi:nuclear transport factor 2 (NTF2) superfamily protein
MENSSRVKIGFLLLFICVLLGFALLLRKSPNLNETGVAAFIESADSAQINSNPGSKNSNKAMLVVKPTPFIRQQGKVKGENSIVKFEKDLNTSLTIQNVPSIWLEYTDERNQIKTVKIPEKIQDFIEKRWFRTLQYSYQNQLTSNREIKANIYKNYINDAAVFATAIDDFEIITPLEKRKISQEEAFAIINLTAKLAVERYEELQKMASQLKAQKISE